MLILGDISLVSEFLLGNAATCSHVWQIRVQELETAIETRDNEVLRALKASKEKSFKRLVEKDTKSPDAKKFHPEDQPVQLSAPLSNSRMDIVTNTSNCSLKIEDCNSKKDSDAYVPLGSGAPNTLETPCILIDDDASELPTADLSLPNFNKCRQSCKTFTVESRGLAVSGLKNTSNVNIKASYNDSSTTQPAISGSRNCNDLTRRSTTALNEDAMLLDDAPTQPMLTIRKEAPGVLPLSRPGNSIHHHSTRLIMGHVRRISLIT